MTFKPFKPHPTRPPATPGAAAPAPATRVQERSEAWRRDLVSEENPAQAYIPTLLEAVRRRFEHDARKHDLAEDETAYADAQIDELSNVALLQLVGEELPDLIEQLVAKALDQRLGAGSSEAEPAASRGARP